MIPQTFSESNSNNTASSTVGYRATAADESSAFAIVSGSKVPDCLTTAVAAVLNDAIKHPTDPSDTLPAGAQVGTDHGVANVFSAVRRKEHRLSSQGASLLLGLNIDVYVDIIFSIKGRAVRR